MNVQNESAKSLYYKDSKGAMRHYSITNHDKCIVTEYGLLNGVKTSHKEYVQFGLGGRTLQEQIESRIRSKINKKKDKGYCDSIEQAEREDSLNSLGLEKPMLAVKIEDVKNFDYDVTYIQKKYNGYRCLIKNIGGSLISYSRNGKILSSIDHIKEDLKIPEGVTIDGELYCHNTPLQTIGSWVKRCQKGSENLKMIVYDTIEDTEFSDRFEVINSYSLGRNSSVAETYTQKGKFDYQPLLRKAISEGYEGLILRKDGVGYEVGKRSKSLIKVKSFLDEEFLVVGISESKEGWAVLECQIPWKLNDTFSVSAPGTLLDKIEVYKNKNKYIGKSVSVKYSEITVKGKPFHPVAMFFREKNDE